MFAIFSRRPIAQQLILAMIAALFVVFSLMAFIVQNRADSAAIAVTERNLEHEATLMAGMLDSIFDVVKIRGEEESQFFAKFIGSQPELGVGSVKTGDIDLPLVKLGGEVINGNERQLKAFRDLTGDDSAFLLIHDNKLYRLATLLKDKDGKSTVGTQIANSDPVAKAVLSGQNYQGLAIRGGKYHFSTVKVLKGADGKPWGAYSVRISLDNDLKRIRDQFGSLVAWLPVRPAMYSSFARPMRRALANSYCIPSSKGCSWAKPTCRRRPRRRLSNCWHASRVRFAI